MYIKEGGPLREKPVIIRRYSGLVSEDCSFEKLIIEWKEIDVGSSSAEPATNTHSIQSSLY